MKRLLLAGGAIAACWHLGSVVGAFGSGYLMSGIYTQGWLSERKTIDAIEVWSGRRVTLAGTFLNLQEHPSIVSDRLNHIWSARATPFVNIEVTVDPELRDGAARVASGEFDSAIEQMATMVKRWLDMGEGRSLLVAPFAEMNTANLWGCDPANFRVAYARVVEIFANAGIQRGTQLRWVFAPNGWSDSMCGYHEIAPYYPGSDLVDAIGISSYNFGPKATHEKRDHSAEFVLRFLQELYKFAPGKPYLLAQIGTSPVAGSTDSWLRDMVEILVAHDNVLGFIYFNLDKREQGPKEQDWRVFDVASGIAFAGFREVLQNKNVLYEWPLWSWFQGGDLESTFALPPKIDERVGLQVPPPVPEFKIPELPWSTPGRINIKPPDLSPP